MKIHITKYDPQRVGGGWTFSRNLANGLGQSSYEEADVYFIPSASMLLRADVLQAKKDGKKIVLRLDNVIRNSRNRNSGMSRMKDFCEMADLVIYQSEWAKKFLMPFTQTDGPVILNGVDLEKFQDNNNGADDSYLYIRSSRDEGKQWIMAWYWFVNNPGRLEIVGKFSPDNLIYNFDFYNNEKFVFMGEQIHIEDVYHRNKYFLYTYLNDACSNTLLEARASGCEIIDVFGMLQTGGAPEIMSLSYDGMSVERMNRQYEQQLSNLA